MNKILTIFFLVLLLAVQIHAENGYDLWLRYPRIENEETINLYKKQFHRIVVVGNSETHTIINRELRIALKGLLGFEGIIEKQLTAPAGLLISTPENCPLLNNLITINQLKDMGPEGYLIFQAELAGNNTLIVTANSESGLLYGTFHLLRLLQTDKNCSTLLIKEKPLITHRLLNHWDNLDRTVERGYSGFSIWDWHKLPDYIDQRYIDYARANASLGINGVVLTNVNANALILTKSYLEKVAALADVFRPYNIKVYLTARFSAPVEIGGLKSTDPTLPEVKKWWQEKTEEIYNLIPDFGGFLVKANSEGQPGPQNYGKGHDDGANMLAEALGNRGVVMWRAFVYDNHVPEDRAKQAYNEFKPLDGKFQSNVFVQVKNGAIDFQPREPFHPLFAAMPNTPLMMEFQITQEYLGGATHWVFLAPMYKEVLDANTWAKRSGAAVSKVIDGSLDGHQISGMAGVSNIGNDINWTGHPFAQANWFAFGRLAWNHHISSSEIADEWLRMTFTNDQAFLQTVTPLMLNSHDNAVSYMTPLGLHHIMAWDHHWGPGPWVNNGRPDWTSVYYHRADKKGIGFDRTSKGSKATEQYFQPVAKLFDQVSLIPEKYLLWFHHLPWDYQVKSGRILWDELVYHYYKGAEYVLEMQKQWDSIKDLIDHHRFSQVQQLLAIQAKEAAWWRDACLLYFQQFSGLPIPEGYEKPSKTLDYFMNLEFKYVPGIQQK